MWQDTSHRYWDAVGATGCEGKAAFSWNRAGLLQHGGPWNEASPRTADSRTSLPHERGDLESFGKEDYEQACAKRGLTAALKAYKAESSGGRVSRVKAIMPLVVLMCQVM